MQKQWLKPITFKIYNAKTNCVLDNILSCILFFARKNSDLHRWNTIASNQVNAWMATENCKPDLPLSRHLRSTGHHDSFGKLKVTIIDHNPKWDDKSRQERESFWIRKLKTLSPNGINEKKCWSPPVVLGHTVCSIGPKYIFHTGGPFFWMSLGIIPFSTIFWQCYLIHLPIMSHFYIYFYF